MVRVNMGSSMAPCVPGLGQHTIAQIIGTERNSSKCNLRTSATIEFLRKFIAALTSSSVTMQQAQFPDLGVRGRIWVSRVEFPVPIEDDVWLKLMEVIEDTKQDDMAYDEPKIASVSAEWIGYRPRVNPQAKEPLITEAGKYAQMMNAVKSPVTILYFHGGGYYLMDPSTNRKMAQDLSRSTGGRVLSVRYRLAPQHPFPSALLDALLAYMYLLYPPPDAYHKPTSPSNIVFAGDSAGGNLCFALILTLLNINKNPGKDNKIMFNGKERECPLPAGVAVASPWLDLTKSLCSRSNNAKYDYMPKASVNPAERLRLNFPACEAWPTPVPRADLFCQASMLTHPIVSPSAAPLEMWKDCPPVFILVGEQLFTDECKMLAIRLWQMNVRVRMRMFKTMPHCFSLVLHSSKPGRIGTREWGNFCVDMNPTCARARALPEEELVFVYHVRKRRKEKLTMSEFAQTVSFSQDMFEMWIEEFRQVAMKTEQELLHANSQSIPS